MIVFYDGDCGLCNDSVRWLLKRDHRRRLRFAPLQGATAQQRLTPDCLDLESVVFWQDGGTVWQRSDALVALLKVLPAPYPFLGGFLHRIPRGLRERIYRLVARWRHLWRRNRCSWQPLPEDQRDLFFP